MPTYNVEHFSPRGDGVAYEHGKRIFIPGTLPGEVVIASPHLLKHDYTRASLLEVVSPSPHRVGDTCKQFGTCGGCQFLHCDYETELEFKSKLVADEIATLNRNIFVAPCLGAAQRFGYRHKVLFPFGEENGHLRTGLYAAYSHQLVEVVKCLIHLPLADQIAREALDLLDLKQLRAYDESSGEGHLRHIMVRTASSCEEAVVLVVTAKSDNSTIEHLREVGRELTQANSIIKGFVANINPDKSNRVIGSRSVVLAGRDYINESALGLKIQLSAESFFQVNPAQAKVIFSLALNCASLSPETVAVDVFSGTGILTLLAAQLTKKTYGVEVSKIAVQDAERNAALNGITNVEFICDKAEFALAAIPHADVIFLDPPRSGCGIQVMRGVLNKSPQKVVYVSCNPHSLCRDIEPLLLAGYTVVTAQPVDMFTGTAHVETVVLLERLS